MIEVILEEVQTDVESWQISGKSPEAYEKYLVPGFFKPWAETLTDLVSPAPGSTILDVACGTGIVARTISSTVNGGVRVTGLDNNREMLKQASKLSEKSGLEIDWQQGDAGKLPFEEPIGTGWPETEPMAMTSPDQFRPGPPPALDGETYAREFNEVKRIGRKDSEARTGLDVGAYMGRERAHHMLDNYLTRQPGTNYPDLTEF